MSAHVWQNSAFSSQVSCAIRVTLPAPSAESAAPMTSEHSLLTPTAQRADLSNWRNAPLREWAFKNVEKLIPCERIAAAGAQPRALPSAEHTFAQFALEGAQGRTVGLADFLQQTATDGFIVLHHGNIVYEYYGHGNSEKSRHILMSASKSLTGLVAGMLERDGLFDSAAPVLSYLPELAGTLYEAASVRHLLDMRTGFQLKPEQLKAYQAATGWWPQATAGSTANLAGFFRGLKGVHTDHGGAFKYVSANTDLLGWALERATGKRVAELISELLWQPMGAQSDALITVDRNGLGRCTAGISATARDLARVGQLVVDSRAAGQNSIVPSAWIDDTAANGDQQAWRSGEWGNLFKGMGVHYRNCWYVVNGKTPLLFAMGIHGQHLFVDRDNGIVIAKLSSQEQVDHRAIRTTHQAVQEIRRCLAGYEE
jgi:CubicO group peptidase (beta-lactamase class C family)